MNVFNIINISNIIIYTKIINITSKSCFFFKLSVDQSLEMFPRQNGLAIISESFALNLIISIPLTNNYLLHCNVNLNQIPFLLL